MPIAAPFSRARSITRSTSHAHAGAVVLDSIEGLQPLLSLDSVDIRHCAAI